MLLIVLKLSQVLSVVKQFCLNVDLLNDLTSELKHLFIASICLSRLRVRYNCDTNEWYYYKYKGHLVFQIVWTHFLTIIFCMLIYTHLIWVCIFVHRLEHFITGDWYNTPIKIIQIFNFIIYYRYFN